MKLSLPQLVVHNPFEPFTIPEKMVWTASALKTFRRCKRKFFWKYIARLSPRANDKNLLIGAAFHNCLGQWYKGKRSSMAMIARKYYSELSEAVKNNAGIVDPSIYDDMLAMADAFCGMMVGYANTYEDDRKSWNILRPSIERQFMIDMGDFFYAGKIDLVVESKNAQQLVEHKTSSKLRDTYINRLPLDTQIRGYIFGWQSMTGSKINEVLYDVIVKCRIRRKTDESIDDYAERIADVYCSQPDRYFYREKLSFDQSQLDAFIYELHQTHREYKAIIDDVRNEQIAKLASFFGETPFALKPDNPRAWLPNDATCDEYFRECEFIQLCYKGLSRGSSRVLHQRRALHSELDLETESE